jgi:hypothetical protein
MSLSVSVLARSDRVSMIDGEGLSKWTSVPGPKRCLAKYDSFSLARSLMEEGFQRDHKTRQSNNMECY